MNTIWKPTQKRFKYPFFKKQKTSVVAQVDDLRENMADNLKRKVGKDRKALKIVGKVLAFLLTFLVVLAVTVFLLVGLPLIRIKPDVMDFMEKTNNIKAALKNQDLDQLQTNISAAKSSLETLEKSFDQKFSLYKNISYTNNYMQDASHMFKAGEHGLEAALIATKNATPFADVLGFKSSEVSEVKEISNEERVFALMQVLPDYAPALDEVSVELELVQEELSKVDPSRYPKNIRGYEIRGNITSAQSAIRKVNRDLPAIKLGFEKLPSVMGFDEPKRYMVLMANENEQRMAGGFNTYVVLMDVNQGVADLAFTIDTYDIDRDRNDLKTLTPPDFISEILGQDLLHARDATSISPDFVVASDFMLNNFWNKNGYLPQRIDGVFQANTTVVESLLEVLGPVVVEGRYFKTDTGSVYVEEREFTHENAFVEMEKIAGEELSEVKGRKDIIKFLMNNLMFRAFNASPETLAPLIQKAVYLLESKQVILTSKDKETQKVFEDLGFAGTLKKVEENSDYLHVNNSNLGAGKRDYLISREIDYVVESIDGKNIATVKLTNNNPSSPEWWSFVTFYRNYFRIYVPIGSKLITAKSLSNEKWDLKAKEGVDEELGKAYFDGYFEIDQNDKFVAEYKYELPASIDINNYNLLVQKQIGEHDTPLTININGKKLESLLVGDVFIDPQSF